MPIYRKKYLITVINDVITKLITLYNIPVALGIHLLALPMIYDGDIGSSKAVCLGGVVVG